jgi:hypothetical protein
LVSVHGRNHPDKEQSCMLHQEATPRGIGACRTYAGRYQVHADPAKQYRKKKKGDGTLRHPVQQLTA